MHVYSCSNTFFAQYTSKCVQWSYKRLDFLILLTTDVLQYVINIFLKENELDF